MNYLITGAAGDIGKAVAATLIERRARGLLLVDRDGEGLARAAAKFGGGETVISTCRADLAEPDSGEAVVKAMVDDFGTLDGVVSNAGLISASPLCDLSAADFDYVFAVNARAAWLLGKAARKYLAKSRGAFVATSSITATEPVPNVGAYPASKAALVMLCKQMALEWAADGIRVNCVAPGTTETGMTAGGLADPSIRAAREGSIPVGRVGAPADIAAVIAFLLSPEASFVNGVNWLVDGGQAISLFYNKAAAVRQN